MKEITQIRKTGKGIDITTKEVTDNQERRLCTCRGKLFTDGDWLKEGQSAVLFLSWAILVPGKIKALKLLVKRSNDPDYLESCGEVWDAEAPLKERALRMLADNILIMRIQRTLGPWFYQDKMLSDENARKYSRRFSYPFEIEKAYGVKIMDFKLDIPEVCEIYVNGECQGYGLVTFNEEWLCPEITFLFITSHIMSKNIFLDYDQGNVPLEESRKLSLYKLCDLNDMKLSRKEMIIAGMLAGIRII